MSTRLWMRPTGWGVEPPYLAVYRNCFELARPAVLRFTYSADERATFFCDGERIADGPSRGTPERWFTAAVELPLGAGRHALTARLLAFGRNLTAYGQMSVCAGLHVEDSSGVLSRDWEYQLCMGCTFANTKTDWGSYAHLIADEDFNWNALDGRDGEWKPAVFMPDERALVPTPLPPMRYEEIFNYQRVGSTFLFDDYVNVYGDYVFSGSGEARLRWAEPGCEPEAFTSEWRKGHKPGEPYPFLSGSGDCLRLTGDTIRWRDYWWHAGRTLEITLLGDVKIESARFFQTGYPWTRKRSLDVPDDERMSRLLRKSWRTLQACSFETLMDCAYYEQLQYISDSRFDMLCFYELSDDTRLIENALRQFSEGQHQEGFLSCRYPSKERREYRPALGELYQLHIPSFTAFYIQMAHDFARLRKNDGLVRELMPSFRKASDYLENTIGTDGLLHAPGWNFIDWLPNWEAGIPPECRYGEGCTLNLIYVLALKDLADLERSFGSEANAAKAEALAARLKSSIYAAYYDKAKGAFAENKSRSYYSEHAQALALLALGETSVVRSLSEGALDECGIAFSFYYLEACRVYCLDGLFRRRLEKFLTASDAPQLRTMPELFLNSWWLRSDCHAWGAHCLYHHFAKGSILDRIPRSSLKRPPLAIASVANA